MSQVIVRIVAPPSLENRPKPVDFDESDAREWARFAIKHNAWQAACEIGPTSSNAIMAAFRTEVAVVIASPDGRAAVWYGVALAAAGPRFNRTRGEIDARPRGEVAHVEAAYAATGSAAASRFFDNKVKRGGDRDVSLLALAACRVLHAKAFVYAPTHRDLLLSEFAVLTGAHRPDTTHLIKASITALEAASTLITIREYAAARALLTGKGVFKSACSP